MRMQASLRTPLSFTVKDAIATAECLQRAVRDVHLVEKEPMPNFAEKTINSWAEFHAYTIEQNPQDYNRGMDLSRPDQREVGARNNAHSIVARLEDRTETRNGN